MCQSWAMNHDEVSGARPLILLTNDDGILSPGLRAAAEALCDLGELLIVAPAVQQTGMGRAMPAITSGAELGTNRLELSCQAAAVYTITAAPAQAVLFGVLAIAPRRPALVVSGINHGENLGTTVTASGTVGAALMGAELDIPSLAVSFETDKAYHFDYGHEIDWTAPAHFTRLFSRLLLDMQLPFDVDVLKVDAGGVHPLPGVRLHLRRGAERRPLRAHGDPRRRPTRVPAAQHVGALGEPTRRAPRG